MRSTKKKRFTFILLILLIIFWSLSISVNYFSYQQVITYLKPASLRPIYQEIHNYENNLFTVERFYFLQSSLLIFSLFSSILSFFFIRHFEKIYDGARVYYLFLKEKFNPYLLEVKLLNRKEKMLLIIVSVKIILFVLFYSLGLNPDLHKFSQYQYYYDESLSYNYFVTQGFSTIISYYPDTNNHILYNIFCYLTNFIFQDKYLTMRIPVFLMSILCYGILFIYINKKFNFSTAIITLASAGFLYNTGIYATVGRGYIFLYLFVLISSISLLSYLKSPAKAMLSIFIISNILGFYSIPTYVFHFTTIAFIGSVYLLYSKNVISFRNFIISCILTGIGVFILYSPVMLISGYGALVSDNRWLEKLPLIKMIQILPVYGAELLEFIFSIHKIIPRGYIVAIAIMMCLTVLFIKKQSHFYKSWFLLLISSLIIPIITCFVLQVFPPYRSLSYISFLVFPCLGLFISDVLKKNSLTNIYFLYLIVFMFFIYGCYTFSIR